MEERKLKEYSKEIVNCVREIEGLGFNAEEAIKITDIACKYICLKEISIKGNLDIMTF